MRLPWFSWEKTLRRLGLRLTAKSRRPEYRSLHPHLERLEPRELLTVYMPGMEPVYGTLPSATEPATSIVAGSATAGSVSAGTVSTASVSTGSAWSSANASLSSATNIYATVAPADPLPPSAEVLPETTADFDADVFWPADFTFEPTVTGTVGTSGQSGLILVEIDEDGDFVGDGLAIADEQGVFEYTPQYFAEDTVPLNIRAVSWDESSGDFVAGNWQTLTLPVTWTVVYADPAAEPEVDEPDNYPDPTDSDDLDETVETIAPAVSQADATTSPSTPASAPITSAPPAADDGDHKIDDEILNQSGITKVRVYPQSPRETEVDAPVAFQPVANLEGTAATTNSGDQCQCGDETGNAVPAAAGEQTPEQMREELKKYITDKFTNGLSPEEREQFWKGFKDGFIDGFMDYVRMIMHLQEMQGLKVLVGFSIVDSVNLVEQTFGRWALGKESFDTAVSESRKKLEEFLENSFGTIGGGPPALEQIKASANVMGQALGVIKTLIDTPLGKSFLTPKFGLINPDPKTEFADSLKAAIDATPPELLPYLIAAKNRGAYFAGTVAGMITWEMFEETAKFAVTAGASTVIAIAHKAEFFKKLAAQFRRAARAADKVESTRDLGNSLRKLAEEIEHLAIKHSGPVTMTLPDSTNLTASRRLNAPDAGVGRVRPGQAATASQLEGSLGKMEPHKTPQKGDFLITEGPNKGKSVDLMFTADSPKHVEMMNRYFDKNWQGIQTQLRDHLEKADIVPLDFRSLDAAARKKILDYLNSLPNELTKKAIILK